MWAHVSVGATAYQREHAVLCACFAAPSAKCVSSFKVAFIQGRELPNERTCICICCMLSAGEGAVKKKMSEVDKENEDKSFIVGLVGEKDRLNWGVGENWQRKISGWFPVGIKALGSLHGWSLKMGERNNMQSSVVCFYWPWKGSLFFQKATKHFCCTLQKIYQNAAEV